MARLPLLLYTTHPFRNQHTHSESRTETRKESSKKPTQPIPKRRQNITLQKASATSNPHSIAKPEGNCMKTLVIYDTTSANRNTEKVATTISDVLKSKGLDVDCIYVKEADPASVKNYNCVLAGSPTQVFRATAPIIRFLDEFAKNEFAGKTAAAFDTQLQARWSGNAAKGIEKKLEKLGFKIIMPPLVTYVEGKLQEVHLKEGELEKTKKYAQDLANKLHR